MLLLQGIKPTWKTSPLWIGSLTTLPGLSKKPCSSGSMTPPSTGAVANTTHITYWMRSYPTPLTSTSVSPFLPPCTISPIQHPVGKGGTHVPNTLYQVGMGAHPFAKVSILAPGGTPPAHICPRSYQKAPGPT